MGQVGGKAEEGKRGGQCLNHQFIDSTSTENQSIEELRHQR